ncbi:hypothetical protein [Streptomyces sp. NPDC048720]|uniref:hypothetical protein n=1 Tax=Streptomyces sp. NPDC048720 TaxID=3365588 RepID=UPI003712420A
MFDTDTRCQVVWEARLGMDDSRSWDRLNGSLALVAWLEGLLDERSAASGAGLPVIVGS